MATGRRHYSLEPTPDNMRLLWDRINDLEGLITTANATITSQATTITSLQSQITSTTKKADEALLTAGQPMTGTVAGGSGAGGPGGNQGGTDDGYGSQGCSEALDDGHVPPGSPLTAVTAGMIVCGTGREYSALKAVTVDLPTRLTNAEELLRRMIWHLNLAGFTAGRQNNSSTGVRFSNDKLTVSIDGVFRAYDTMGAYDDFTTPIQTRMGQVFPARYVADAGVTD
jgi:hypothetical protein